jgi:hypothetical protein
MTAQLRSARLHSDSLPPGGGAGTGKGGSRRLPDRIIAVAHQACDGGRDDVAWLLVGAAERMMLEQKYTPSVQFHRSLDRLVAALERIWLLRHGPEAAEL